jgi:paraquat-inducible protein B
MTFDRPRHRATEIVDGSLDSGTPIFYRRLQVGEVASYTLDSDGQSFSVKVFVNAPYDKYVSRATRFWQASGIDVSLTASGLSVQTQSLLSILIGGIAFETPAGSTSPAAEANTDFPLFGDRATAFKLSANNPQDFVLIFKDSVRGLAPGAPVEFHGIPVGEVVDIQANINAETFEFSSPVTIRVDATRLSELQGRDFNARIDGSGFGGRRSYDGRAGAGRLEKLHREGAWLLVPSTGRSQSQQRLI